MAHGPRKAASATVVTSFIPPDRSITRCQRRQPI